MKLLNLYKNPLLVSNKDRNANHIKVLIAINTAYRIKIFKGVSILTIAKNKETVNVLA